MKILLLGYSNIAKKRFINYFIKKKLILYIASESFKDKIPNISKQFYSYEVALKQSDADIVYISLPNSLHYKWALKALSLGYHVVVDKPICDKTYELKELIKISKKKNKLIAEATFFNYHKQFKKVENIIKGKKNIQKIDIDFTIPKPKKNTLLLSRKFKGGALMDMGPYAAAVARIFFNEKIISHKVQIKKNKDNLITSFKILINYKSKIYSGKFKFGGSYKNELIITTKSNSIILNRVFSPPSDQSLNLTIDMDNYQTIFTIKKDNCFANFFNEVLKNIKNKKFKFYLKNIKFDNDFRNKILK